MDQYFWRTPVPIKRLADKQELKQAKDKLAKAQEPLEESEPEDILVDPFQQTAEDNRSTRQPTRLEVLEAQNKQLGEESDDWRSQYEESVKAVVRTVEEKEDLRLENNVMRAELNQANARIKTLEFELKEYKESKMNDSE